MVVLVSFTYLTGAGAAQRTDCPEPYDDDDCGAYPTYVCYKALGYFICNSSNSTPDEVWAVTDDDETWVWGHLNNNDFCCRTTSTSGILPVIISTDGGNDDVRLRIGREFLHAKSIVSTGAGNDYVAGSPYDCSSGWCDDIDVGAGCDEVYAYGGDDYIELSSSDSTPYSEVRGGDGDDEIHGGGAADYLYGEGGQDYVYGGATFDYIDGGDEFDHLSGEGGDDSIYGGAANDWLCGDAGGDVMDGEGGDHDVCYYDEDDFEYDCDHTYEDDCPF